MLCHDVFTICVRVGLVNVINNHTQFWRTNRLYGYLLLPLVSDVGVT